MAGLYIHIPFCRQACNYCNFHFSTALSGITAMTEAICQEMKLRKEAINEPLTSIYFGGGTPSLLPQQQLEQLFDAINAHFMVAKNAEITLEANPDDISTAQLTLIKQTPVNRFSLGVQSFFDEDLIWMNRAHKAKEAEKAIQMIQDAGFTKTTIDLIYGGPTLSHDHWQKNMEKAVSFGLTHISAYALTVEANTALHHQIKKGYTTSPQEEHTAEQFDMLVNYLETQGFEQYEISNFTKNKDYAVHNTSYWFNKPYLGVGPSAHSFNGTSRSWNIAHNLQYINAISNHRLPLEIEHLTLQNRINEYIMTGLRTIWGCDWHYIEMQYGSEMRTQLQLKIQPFIQRGQLLSDETGFKLAKSARILADGIASELFF